MCALCLYLSPPLWSVCLPCGHFPSLALNPILPSPHSHSGLLNFLFIPMECALNRRLLLAIKFVERGQVFSDVISHTLTQSASRAFLLHSPFHLATKRWHFNFHSRVTLYSFSVCFFLAFHTDPGWYWSLEMTLFSSKELCRVCFSLRFF